MINICLVSLGCAKNTVDSEAILALFKEPDFKIVNNYEESDAIIVNTCGFIQSAKEEGISVILDVLSYKKKTIVIGCLVERYYKELSESLKEVDLFVRFKDEYTKLPTMISNLFDNKYEIPEFDIFKRIDSFSNATSYIKISEGCNNFCAFCAIPFIRGRFVSYEEDKIVEYATKMAKNGVKEIILIGQDPTSYGKDFADKDINLLHLMKRIEAIDGIEFIRPLYLYPEGINEELIQFMASSKKCVHYFDVPIQHISTNVLKNMHRRDTKESTIEKLNLIRRLIPDAVIRTSLIVGFPKETDKDFKELLNFVSEFKFNHIGVFTYSREEGTAAYNMRPQVSQKVKNRRKDEIMKLQQSISYKLNKNEIGKEFKALITGKSKGDYLISCYLNGPDDIDGKIILKSSKSHDIGDVIKAKVISAYVYDIICEEI